MSAAEGSAIGAAEKSRSSIISQGGNMDPKEMKRMIADILRQMELIKDNYTGEITIGINDGGVTYIRKSETLK